MTVHFSQERRRRGESSVTSGSRYFLYGSPSLLQEQSYHKRAVGLGKPQTLVLMLRYFFEVRGLVRAFPCFHWTFVDYEGFLRQVIGTVAQHSFFFQP